MRNSARIALSTTFVLSLLSGSCFTFIVRASASESTISSEVILNANLLSTSVPHPLTHAVCPSNVPAGVAHCNAIVQRGTVNPHEQFQTLDSAAQTLGVDGAYSPAFLQSAYNVQNAINSETAGSGQIVAIVGAYNDPSLVSNLAFYRAHFGLPTCPAGTVSSKNTGCVVQVVGQSGSSVLSTVNNESWALEASIDTQMVSAICPNCQILFVEANSATMVDLGASVNTAIRLGATVVSNSYGSAEYAGETSIASRDYSHKGVPVVVAAGEGSSTVEFPASAPDVIAVGGTTLTQYSQNGTRDGYETAWGGTDSGCSKFEPKPAWQHYKGCSKRSVADIAAVADPDTGVWIYDTDGSSGSMIAGGTSVAAPIIASLFALSGASDKTNAYPVSYLYENRNALYSVTSGASTNCVTYLCDAAHSQVGYNGLTGLGTPGGTPNSFSVFSPLDPPTMPVIESATSADGSVTLTWSPSDPKGQNASLGYEVYEGTTKDFTTQLVNDELSPATSMTISGLTDQTTYYFSVEAVTYGGLSPLSPVVGATPIEVEGEPGAPSDVNVTVVGGEVTVSWTAPSDAGSSQITGYTVTNNEGDTCHQDSDALGSNSCTFDGPVNSSTDMFFVTATNSHGTGAAGTSMGDDDDFNPSIS